MLDGSPESREALIGNKAADTAFGAIMAVRPEDPVRLRLDEVAVKKRIGATVTRLEIPDDDQSATAVSALWILGEDECWSEITSKRGTARVGEPVVAGEPVANATAVRAMRLILGSVSATPIPPDLSERRQAAAVVAQRAMGRARLVLNRDLAPLLLPVSAGGR